MDTPKLPSEIHPSVTEKRVIARMEAEMYTLANPGICLACGADRDGCESDATNYECHDCGDHMVFGAGEIMLMGHYVRPVTRITLTPRPEEIYPLD